MSSRLILLAHGSRNSNWCKTFVKGTRIINKRLEHEASLAYMEMAAPSLENVISRHYLLGDRNFEVLPLFFAAGRHLLHDVPKKIERLNSQYSDIDIRLLDELGCHDAFWTALGDLIANRYFTDKKVTSGETKK